MYACHNKLAMNINRVAYCSTFLSQKGQNRSSHKDARYRYKYEAEEREELKIQ